jgi:hypothetical protein
MSKITKEIVTFQAGEDLLQYARVKVESGTVTVPPEVVYADQSEQAIGVVERDVSDGDLVAVRLITWGGTLEGIANDTFAIGATLYAHDDGEISDTSSGSAIGQALDEATAAGDICEYIAFGVLSTTAATVSYADAGGQTAAATMEAVGAELYTDLLSAQAFIPVPLTTLREVTNFDVGNIAANGGILASDTTPVLDAINAATDGCQRILWAAGNTDSVMFQTPLPPKLDVASDVVIHTRVMAGTTDAMGFTTKAHFNEGDGSIADTGETIQSATWAEKIITIAAADVPAGAQTLTVELTPNGAGTTDVFAMSAIWIEHTSVLLTS